MDGTHAGYKAVDHNNTIKNMEQEESRLRASFEEETTENNPSILRKHSKVPTAISPLPPSTTPDNTVEQEQLRLAKNAATNLPFLVQVMQPSHSSDATAVKEQSGAKMKPGPGKQQLHKRQISNYSLNGGGALLGGNSLHKKSSRSVKQQHLTNELLNSSDSDSVDTEETNEKDEARLINHNKDALLGLSCRLMAEKTNKDIFLDHLLQHAAQMDNKNSLRQYDMDDSMDSSIGLDDDRSDIEGGNGVIPVSNRGGDGIYSTSTNNVEQRHCGADDTETTSLLLSNRSIKKKFLPFQRKPKIRRSKSRRHCCYHATSRWSKLMDIVRPRDVLERILWFLLGTCLCGIAPLMGLAYGFYYYLGNPSLPMDFLTNTNTVAWYALLAARWLVTLTLARCTQYFLIIATLRTGIMTTCTGPFITLMAMQSIGWPFICMSWGLWNLILLYGNHTYCQHWLCFTEIALFSPKMNPDADHVLESELYGKLILSMIAIGFLSGIKRTALALFLSRRMLLYFKPQLEDVLYQMRLVTGVAGLAMETTKVGFGTVISDAVEKATEVQIDRQTKYMDAVPSFGPDSIRDHLVFGDDGDLASFENSPEPEHNSADNGRGKDNDFYDDQTDSTCRENWERFMDLHQKHTRNQSSASRSGGHILATMESWEPPVDKASKVGALLL